MDPITKDFPWLTPYQFASNMPIAAVDLDGLEAYIATKTSDAFSMLNWTNFVKSYSDKLLNDQKLKVIDDKDCADLAVEMMALYHKEMSVRLIVKIKFENGKTVTLDSNDPKYQDKMKKDFAGNYYETAFDWFLDELKQNVGPNGIPQLSFNVKGDELKTGDMMLFPNSGGGWYHTQVINENYKTGNAPSGIIQSSGHYKGRGHKENDLAKPAITKEPFVPKTWPNNWFFRWNFLKGKPAMTDDEKPAYMKPIPAVFPPSSIPEINPTPSGGGSGDDEFSSPK